MLTPHRKRKSKRPNWGAPEHSRTIVEANTGFSITINYVIKENEGNACHRAVHLDKVISPAIIAALNKAKIPSIAFDENGRQISE